MKSFKSARCLQEQKLWKKWLDPIEYFLLCYLLPFGLISLLTGMFWTASCSVYHKIYNISIIAPVLLLLLLSPRRIKAGAGNLIFCSFALFAVYMLITLFWSGTDEAVFSLLRRPLYIVVLFYSAYLIHFESPVSLEKLLKVSLVIAVTSAVITLAVQWGQNRLSGMAALYNPLLTSHVYGAFASLALALSVKDRERRGWWTAFFFVLLVLVIKTGSRTPLVGLFFVVGWLALIFFNRRTLVYSANAVFLAGAFLMAFPETIMSRGFSYRPEIWKIVWAQITEAFWFGHGYDHPLLVPVAVLNETFSDPHNIMLGVWYSGGLIGLALWLQLYGSAIRFSWQQRNDLIVLLASVLLVFGFAAGLTEGGSFMSRPKEHWFLIWIPMALLAAVSRGNALKKDELFSWWCFASAGSGELPLLS